MSDRPQTLAVVAPDAPVQAIAGVMGGGENGLRLTRFDSQQHLLDEAGQCLCAVLLWTDKSNRLVAKSLEPLTRRFTTTPVLVGCDSIKRWEVRSLLVAGVAGIVLEGDLDHALLPCLQAARAGQICVPRDYSRQLVPPTLSSREKQILNLVVMGYMNSEIAAQLFLAESTVKSHLSSAFAKLGVRSRNEAAQLIVDQKQELGAGMFGVKMEPLEAAPTRP